MTNGRNNLNRGGGAAGGSGGKRRYLPYQPNRSSRRYRDASERCSPHPMNRPLVQRNQPPTPPPTHERRRGSRSRRAGGAWSTSVAPPPPQPGTWADLICGLLWLNQNSVILINVQGMEVRSKFVEGAVGRSEHSGSRSRSICGRACSSRSTTRWEID